MKNSRALNRAGRWLKHNAPIFLSVAGAAGLIATAYLTAKETPEAKKVYDEGKEDAKTVMDKVCLTADVADYCANDVLATEDFLDALISGK